MFFRGLKQETFAVALLVVVGALLAGCGHDAPDDDFIVCETETRATPYHAGLAVRSDNGIFAVHLLSSVPGPPVKGQNSWTIQVDEVASAMALADLDISVMPWMPDHLHGTTPVVVSPLELPGHYQLKPVYLYMSGFWQVRLTIAAASIGGGTIDSAIIPVCIP